MNLLEEYLNTLSLIERLGSDGQVHMKSSEEILKLLNDDELNAVTSGADNLRRTTADIIARLGLQESDIAGQVIEKFADWCREYKRIGDLSENRYRDPAVCDSQDGFEQLWIRIPTGEFCLDVGPEGDGLDLRRTGWPVANVQKYASFEIANFPVVVGNYDDFINDGGYSNSSYWIYGGFGIFECPLEWTIQLKTPYVPVVGVSWYEACAYAQWLGKRLPTELEWERVARGPQGKIFPWGNDMISSEYSNYDGIVGYPTAVGNYPNGVSSEGVHDLVGNVWEWVSDPIYTSVGSHSHVSQDAIQYSFARGGSWADGPYFCNSIYRVAQRADFRHLTIGFRMARDF